MKKNGFISLLTFIIVFITFIITVSLFFSKKQKKGKNITEEIIFENKEESTEKTENNLNENVTNIETEPQISDTTVVQDYQNIDNFEQNENI